MEDQFARDGRLARGEIGKPRVGPARIPMVKKPRHEYRYVRRLGIERLRFAREILPCLLNESRLELALNEAQQSLSKVTYDRPNAAAQEFLRRFHDGVFRAQAAVLVLLAAAAGTGVVASGFHVVNFR